MVERGTAPLADLHLEQIWDKWKLRSEAVFCVMQKELAHLRVSVLHLTHNPISVSSQSLSDISTKFFFLFDFISAFPIYSLTFQHLSPARYLSSVSTQSIRRKPQ